MLYAYAPLLAKLPIESYSLEQQLYILLFRLKLLDLITKQIHPQTVNEEFMAFLRGNSRQIHLIRNKDSSANKKRSVLAHRVNAKNDIILSYVANNNEPSDLNNIVTMAKNYLASPIEFIKLQQVANVHKTLFAHADFSSEGRLAEIIYNLLEHGFKWPKNFFKELDNTSYFQLQENQISLQKERRKKIKPSGNSKDNYIRIDLGQDIEKRKMLSSLIATTYSTEELEEIRKDCHRNPNIFSLHDKLDSFDLSEPLLKEMNKQLSDNGIPEELFPVIIRLILQNHGHSIQRIKLKLVQEITQMYEAMINANKDPSLFYFYNANKVLTTAKAQTPYLIPVVAPNSKTLERKFVLRSIFQLSATPINDSDEAIPCADVSIDVIFTINGNQLSLGIGSNFHCYHSEMYNLVTYTYGRPKTGKLNEESIPLPLRKLSQAPEPCALDERLNQVFTPNRKIKQNFGMTDYQSSPKPSPKNLLATSKRIKKTKGMPFSPHTPYTAASEKVISHFYAAPQDAPQPPKRRSTLDSEAPNATTIRINAAFFSERKVNKAPKDKQPSQQPSEAHSITIVQPAIKTELHLNLPPRKSTKVISSRSPGLAGLSPGYLFSPTPTPSKTPSIGSARSKVSFSSASTDYKQTPRFPLSPNKPGK